MRINRIFESPSEITHSLNARSSRSAPPGRTRHPRARRRPQDQSAGHSARQAGSTPQSEQRTTSPRRDCRSATTAAARSARHLPTLDDAASISLATDGHAPLHLILSASTPPSKLDRRTTSTALSVPTTNRGRRAVAPTLPLAKSKRERTGQSPAFRWRSSASRGPRNTPLIGALFDGICSRMVSEVVQRSGTRRQRGEFITGAAGRRNTDPRPYAGDSTQPEPTIG